MSPRIEKIYTCCCIFNLFFRPPFISLFIYLRYCKVVNISNKQTSSHWRRKWVFCHPYLGHGVKKTPWPGVKKQQPGTQEKFKLYLLRINLYWLKVKFYRSKGHTYYKGRIRRGI
uniref:Uncharacterized protein n=1 Tax=Cacopsylla melanoneura TaxID=428564 RepID=A0A8D8X5I7_9HEMI